MAGFEVTLYGRFWGDHRGNIRLIMTVDDDPVFEQTLVTLFRVVQHNEPERSYRSIAHLLYRNQSERNGRAS